MNPILTSAASSAVVSTINESGGLKNPFVYTENNRLVPPHSMQILPVTHSGGTIAANKTFSFNIPKSGMLCDMYLQFTFDVFGGTNGLAGTDTATDGQVTSADGTIQLQASTSTSNQNTSTDALTISPSDVDGRGRRCLGDPLP